MQLEQKKVGGEKSGKSGNDTGSFASAGGFLELFLLVFSYTGRQKAVSLDPGRSNTHTKTQ